MKQESLCRHINYSFHFGDAAWESILTQALSVLILMSDAEMCVILLYVTEKWEAFMWDYRLK